MMTRLPVLLVLFASQALAQYSGTYRNQDGSWGRVNVDEDGNGTWRGYDGSWGRVKLESDTPPVKRSGGGLLSFISRSKAQKAEENYYKAKTKIVQYQYADLVMEAFQRVKNPAKQELLDLRKKLVNLIEDESENALDEMEKIMKHIYAEEDAKDEAKTAPDKQAVQSKKVSE